MRCAGQSRACLPVPLASSIGVGCLKYACISHVDSEVTALPTRTLLHHLLQRLPALRGEPAPLRLPGPVLVLVLILILANAFTGEREVHRLRACER
jgi:hypothetical protein